MQLVTRFSMTDLAQLEALERRYYSAEYITPPAETALWLAANPHSLMAVADHGKICGCMCIFPVRPAVFDEIIAGRVNDRLLEPAAMLTPAEMAGGGLELNFFLSCAVVDETCRRQGGTTLLLKAYADHINDLLARGNRPGLMASDSVTPAGEKFSARLGLKPRGRSDHDTLVSLGSTADFLERVAGLTC